MFRVSRAGLVCLTWSLLCAGFASGAAPKFRFDRDTFAFANETVFEYREGHPHLREARDADKPAPFTRRCFVMCRASDQFRKFARFDPTQPPPDARALAAKVRAVTRHPAWRGALPPERRVVIPGYADLRALSAARGEILQENIGLGWPTYFRLGNWRMVFHHGPGHQSETHDTLEAALDRGNVFIGYLTTFPKLYINHAILVYARKPSSGAEKAVRYRVYDPNHPESPRELTYDPAKGAFSYEKDWDFIGGQVTVLQIFGRPVQ
jgi:hypothetical protein